MDESGIKAVTEGVLPDRGVPGVEGPQDDPCSS